MLSMSHAGHHDPLRCGIASQLVRHNHARSLSRDPQQFAKEPHGSKAIPLWLNKDVEDNPILIDRTPEIVRDAIDLQEHFIQVPLVTDPVTPPSQTSDIRFAELGVAQRSCKSGHRRQLAR